MARLREKVIRLAASLPAGSPLRSDLLTIIRAAAEEEHGPLGPKAKAVGLFYTIRRDDDAPAKGWFGKKRTLGEAFDEMVKSEGVEVVEDQPASESLGGGARHVEVLVPPEKVDDFVKKMKDSLGKKSTGRAGYTAEGAERARNRMKGDKGDKGDKGSRSYDDYVEEKKGKGEKPMPRDEWESRYK